MRALLFLLATSAAPIGNIMTDTTDCRSLFDFAKAEDRAAWSTQNDTVMGGKSRGTISEEENALVFEGELVTQDGGFVQIQADLPDGALTGLRSLRVVGEGGGRSWRARVETDVRVSADEMRGHGDAGHATIRRSGPDLDGPAVAFAAPIEGLTDGEGKAGMTDPKTSVHGRPVEGAEWDPTKATKIGLILADGKDGPYRLVVERVDACE